MINKMSNKLLKPYLPVPIFSYKFMNKCLFIYPTSFILDEYKKEKFEYMLLLAQGSISIEGNNNLLQFDVKEIYLCPSRMSPSDLNKLYRKSYEYNKLTKIDNSKLFIAIRFVKYVSDDNFTYKDVTSQMIELANENYRLELFS